MAGTNGNRASARVRHRWAGFLLVVAVVFFVVTAVYGFDLAKPAWAFLSLGAYVIFGNVAGDFLLRVVTGMAATAREDSAGKGPRGTEGRGGGDDG